MKGGYHRQSERMVIEVFEGIPNLLNYQRVDFWHVVAQPVLV
jgi:hypothetical protein